MSKKNERRVPLYISETGPEVGWKACLNYFLLDDCAEYFSRERAWSGRFKCYARSRKESGAGRLKAQNSRPGLYKHTTARPIQRLSWSIDRVVRQTGKGRTLKMPSRQDTGKYVSTSFPALLDEKHKTKHVVLIGGRC